MSRAARTLNAYLPRFLPQRLTYCCDPLRQTPTQKSPQGVLLFVFRCRVSFAKGGAHEPSNCGLKISRLSIQSPIVDYLGLCTRNPVRQTFHESTYKYCSCGVLLVSWDACAQADRRRRETSLQIALYEGGYQMRPTGVLAYPGLVQPSSRSGCRIRQKMFNASVGSDALHHIPGNMHTMNSSRHPGPAVPWKIRENRARHRCYSMWPTAVPTDAERPHPQFMFVIRLKKHEYHSQKPQSASCIKVNLTSKNVKPLVSHASLRGLHERVCPRPDRTRRSRTCRARRCTRHLLDGTGVHDVVENGCAPP